MNKTCLNGTWQVSCSQTDIPDFEGTVPGCVLNDLRNANITKEDYFYRDNAEKIQHFENYDWRYTKTFTLEKSDARYNLVFEKLDTYCDIYINGLLAHRTANGFIKHTLDVTRYLKDGENKLEVYFHSPITMVAGMPLRVAAFTAERLNTRRMQCTYGWDWTMRFVTCGINKDVYLEEISDETLIDNAYIYTKNVDEDSAQVGLDLTFKQLNKSLLDFSVYYGDECVKKIRKFCAEDFVRLSFDIANPKLWFPVGYGEPNLYTLKIEDGENLLYSEEFGIRTIKIMEITDPKDSEYHNKCLKLKETPFAQRYDNNQEFSGFILKVNGVRIMCKGANYVPCEPYEINNTEEKLRVLLKRAKNAGVNMIRVWGGGHFEIPFFYEECSRLGIMVTQDFLMACGAYPEKEDWFLEELTKEAEYASLLIRNKPCLMWWSGDNENAVNGSLEHTDYRGRDSAYKAIAPVLYKNDPYREFLPSSPYGGNKYACNTVGTTHNTNFMSHIFNYVRENDDLEFCEHMKNFCGRFIAEEPTMGAVELRSMRKFMTDEDIFGENLDMWNYHTKDNPGVGLFEFTHLFAHKLLGEYKDGADRFMKLKYLQYEWVRVTLEQARREKWFCSGMIYWMLNDCWPAASGWALIDYYNYPKASFYAFKHAAKDVMATIDKNADGSFTAYFSNDTQNKYEVNAKIYLLSYKTGEITPILEKTLMTCNCKNTAVDFSADLQDDQIIICETSGENIWDRTFYKKGLLPIVKAENAVRVVEKGENFIRLAADSYVHAVVLEGECLFSDNYFSMVKGEEIIVTFEPENASCDISLEAYTIE